MKSGERTHRGESSQTGWRRWSAEGWRGRWEKGDNDAIRGWFVNVYCQIDEEADYGWFTFTFPSLILLFHHKEREKRKVRSSRKTEHRKEISTSSLPVSDQHFWRVFSGFAVQELSWFCSRLCLMFSLQLSAHERSHQRSRSAQPLVKLDKIIVVATFPFLPYSTIQVLLIFILY